MQRGEILDKDRILKNFKEIEGKVEKLIEVCRSFQTTNAELRNKIERLENELKAKTAMEENYKDAKSLILSKIDKLISKLGNISELQKIYKD